MRKIISRGKRIDSGKWVHGYLIRDDYMMADARSFIITFVLVDQTTGLYLEHSRYCEVDPETVSEYTGLNDTVRDESIFEGDFLRIYNPEHGVEIDDAEIVEVKWCIDNDYPAFDIPDSVESGESNGLAQALNDGSVVEVVGNRWDNKELLNGAKIND